MCFYHEKFALSLSRRDNVLRQILMMLIIHFPMPDFQTITHLVPNFADRADDPPAPLEDQNRLRPIFKDILGQSAVFIQPVLFRTGRLTVYVEAAVWGQHISHRHERILQHCHAAGLKVNEIKVKVRPGSNYRSNHCESNYLSQEDAPYTPQYDTEKAGNQLDRLASQLDDKGELKKTVSKLAQRVRKYAKKEQDL